MMKPFKIYAVSMVGILFCCMIIILTLQKNIVSIDKIIKEDKNFIYETSITNNYSSHDHAMVYKSKLSSVEKTYDYIDSLLNRKERYKDFKKTENYGIIRYDDRKEVLVYETDNHDVLVQIASEDYVYRNGYGRMYRGMTYYTLLNTRYEREKRTGKIFSSGSFNSSNSNSSGSVRNSSFGSRPSSGGGTSFGK